MRITRILVGLSAVVAVAGVAACSTSTTDAAAGAHLAVAGRTTSVVTSTVDPAPTTTSVAPRVTTTTTPKPVVTTTTTTKPKSVDTRTPAQKAGVPCSATVRACVDLSARKAWLVDDGRIVYGPVSIMSGRVGWPTPVGTFHVEFKDADYVSHEFHVPMPDAVFFYPGIAFHEGSLYEHSHGCIHLSARSASKFFHTLSTGDKVQVVR